jgi:predicted nicotinamide N-methyase
VPDLPGVRLHLAGDVTTLWRQTGEALGAVDPALPYWAFAWVGGLAISRFLFEHPDEVEGRSVLDMAAGSGLCAIVAARCGAASVHGVDIDPFAEAAVAVNARANGVHVGFSGCDLLDSAPPDYDVILAGDVCYEETMASRMVDWLRAAARRGTRVLIGDPGRTYMPRDLERLATYEVRTSREIEASDARAATVYTIAGQA